MNRLFATAAAALAALPVILGHTNTIDLSGQWDYFAAGLNKDSVYEPITLPGSMLTNHKGTPVSVNTQWVSSLYDSSYFFNPKMERYRQQGNMKFPFFLTPETHYVGEAWYRRTVDVPSSWRKRRVMLHLERPHIETTVYVNGHEAGRDSSLSVPHQFDITEHINFGKGNVIEIKVYNGIENVCVGQDSHSVTDQTQGCWNGIAGRIELQSVHMTYVDEVQVYPSIADKKVRVDVALNGSDKKKHTITVTATDPDGKVLPSVAAKAKAGEIQSIDLPLGDDIQLWDEFSPALYTINVAIDGEPANQTPVGIREISTDGKRMMLNGHEIWIRGTVGNCCFPLTGYPPTDEESWLQIFRKCKEYGLNMMRFHSYCPPEAAFAAADKVGFYLQPEGPSWPNHGVNLGRGMTIDRYLMEETQRMVKAYGNHPSFCMLAAGNEPAGDWVKWVGEFVEQWQATGDERRLYCGASVGGGWAWDPKSQYHVKGGARGLDWSRHAPQSADDFTGPTTQFVQKGRTEITFDINEPYLSHEQGQWCAFPDLEEVSQYTGAYKAGNFEIFADLLAENGMAEQSHKFLMSSGKLQTLAYKYEMERNLRTPGYTGFQLLGLNDYSGQGTALVGVLNVFWREKGYCTATDWTQFCAPVVPLAKFPKFVYTASEPVSVPVVAYNAYSDTLRSSTAAWFITDGTHNVASSEVNVGNVEPGQNISLCDVHFPTDGITKPTKYTLTVDLTSANGPAASNSWDFWVYPKAVEMPTAENIFVTDTLDAKAREVLSSGGKVLIAAAGKVRYGNDVQQTYLPVFWNTSWFKMRPPHTTGAYIDTTHPLFREFPTDDWTNLNWWELVNRAQVMNLTNFPLAYQPPVQPIDTWHVSRKLGMVVEANVLGGKLLMTTIDIDRDLDSRVVARQMRKAILTYMESDDFAPEIALAPETITQLFEEEAPQVNMFTKDSPDELKPKLK